MRLLPMRLSLCALASEGAAQDLQTAKTIIEKIRNAYGAHSAYRLELAYRLFQDYHTDKAYEIDTASVRYENGASLFRMGEVETFSDQHLDIMVQHADKVLAVARHHDKISNPLIDFPLDTVLRLCNSARVRPFGPVNCLDLGLSATDATGISVCYDTAAFHLQKLVIYYRQERRLDEGNPKVPRAKPRMEIHYLKVRFDPAPNPARLNVGYYLQKKGEEYVASANFQGYRVLDQRGD